MNISTEMLSKWINQLTNISEKAGQAILEIYQEEDLGIDHKADDSPLTKADLASNKIIYEGLKQLTPKVPIISEESDTPSYEERKTWDYFWLIDPLDGTKEFIKKNGEFTTNIALIHKNEAIAGVVYIPVLDEMYYAIKGQGAFMIKLGMTTKIETKRFSNSTENLHIVTSRSHLNEETQKFISKYKKHQLVTKGSSLKFLSIAKGESDLYPRMAPTMEWDTAAAQIILEEAGGSVCQLNGSKVVYNKEDLLNPFFIASGNKQQA